MSCDISASFYNWLSRGWIGPGDPVLNIHCKYFPFGQFAEHLRNKLHRIIRNTIHSNLFLIGHLELPLGVAHKRNIDMRDGSFQQSPENIIPVFISSYMLSFLENSIQSILS